VKEPRISFPDHGRRVPHVPPDFLWSLVVLANLMRLSSQKAAHATMADAACRKSGSHQRTWADNDFFKCFHSRCPRGLSPSRVFFCPHSNSVGGAAPRLFRPMYAGANMGHPSESRWLILEQQRGIAPSYLQSRLVVFIGVDFGFARRRLSGTLPILGSRATISSHARKASCSKSGASAGRTCQPVVSFPNN
jgi:hypothetical protein